MGNNQKIFFGIFGGEDKEAKIIDEYKYLHLFFDTEMLSKKKDFLLNFFDVVFKKASFLMKFTFKLERNNFNSFSAPTFTWSTSITDLFPVYLLLYVGSLVGLSVCLS